MTAKSKDTEQVSRDEALAFAKAWATSENLARLDAMTDGEIAQQIAEDADVAPELTDEWFENARLVISLKKPRAA